LQAEEGNTLRLILMILFLCFVFGLVAIIGLLGIFSFATPDPSGRGWNINANPWLMPTALAWFIVITVSWTAAVIWQIWKWQKRRPTN
jgi:hypothetical protein